MSRYDGINHIGIAVRTLEGKRELYERQLGGRYVGEEVVAEQQVKVAFFLFGSPGHEVRIELLEPTSDTSAVAKFIEKRGEGIHHIAFTVPDVAASIEKLTAAGLRMVDEQPRQGAHHTRIAFVHPKSTFGVLTEVCQTMSSEDQV